MGRVKTKTLDAVGDRVDDDSRKLGVTGNGGPVVKPAFVVGVDGIGAHLNFKLTGDIGRGLELNGIQIFHGNQVAPQINAVFGVLVRTVSKLVAEGRADDR